MEVRPLTSADAATIASWRYPDRFSTYDVEDATALAGDTWAVAEAGDLFGYCCFGVPARVAGASEEPGTLDVGYGVAPDLMGRGHGMQQLFATLLHDQEQTNRFFGTFAGTVPASEFFATANLARIMGAQETASPVGAAAG